MKKSVLLTRSKAANSALKKKFGNKDLDLIECNLIEYELFSVEAEYINQFSDLVITSNLRA